MNIKPYQNYFKKKDMILNKTHHSGLLPVHLSLVHREGAPINS